MKQTWIVLFVFLWLCVAWWCFQLQCGLSLSLLSLSCMPSWTHWLYSAAILVTQLTTPYIRIAPAAGDNQLTGQAQRHPHTYVIALTAPSTGDKQNKCMCAIFDYSLVICIRALWLTQRHSKKIFFYIHLLCFSGHEKPAWGAIFVLITHRRRFQTGVNPASWIFLIIFRQIRWVLVVSCGNFKHTKLC